MLVIVMLLGVDLHAQQHKEPWNADDYFPAGHFLNDDNDRWQLRAGEVAHYMRLAGIPSWKEIATDNGTVKVRISMLPKYSNPLFISLEMSGEEATLRSCRGQAKCGYVELSTYYEMSDTGRVDVTESHYHGNIWTKGIYGEKQKTLDFEERQAVRQALDNAEMPTRNHTTCWGGFRPPYVIEYMDSKGYNAIYDECYGGSLGRLVEMLVAMADSNCTDMVVYHPNERNGISPAQFAGGQKACQQFIANNMQYPALALLDGEEATILLDLIVERDGSIAVYGRREDDQYGFLEEALRIVSLMPRWKPAVKDGKAVRSSTGCTFRFKLPQHQMPKYGTPKLETRRDSAKWDIIMTNYRRTLRHPQNQTYLYNMGMQYYQEFLLTSKPLKKPTGIDSILYDGRWDSYYDRTPVIGGAADSATRYFYRALAATDSVDLERYIMMFLPIRQLEQYLHLPQNEANRLPYDTLPELHYPATYFFDMADFKENDTVTDYSMSLTDSYFWSAAMSNTLNDAGEPTLYNRHVGEGDTVLRMAFYPSFHPALLLRIERVADSVTLLWCKRDYSVDEETWKTTLHPKYGQKAMTQEQYRTVVSKLDEMGFDTLPRMHHVTMLDGAQWCIERRTAESFEARFTNVAGAKWKALFDYLIRLAEIEENYSEGYYHNENNNH